MMNNQSDSSAPDSPSGLVFLDRDGTMIVDKHYLKDPEKVEWIPGTKEALKTLHDRNYRLFMVSNQSGVGRGYMTEEDVKAVNKKIESDLEEAGVTLDGSYYAPYYSESENPDYLKNKQLRKPAPGMLEKALEEHGLTGFYPRFMVGDKPSDLQAGTAVNCHPILVRTGKGRESEKNIELSPDLVVESFADAVEWIMIQED